MSHLHIKLYKKGLLREIYCLILLFLTVAMTIATSVYTVDTPGNIWYKYRSFYFSFLFIPAIIIALLNSRRAKSVKFEVVILAILVKDLIFFLAGGQDSVIQYDFSLTLILLSGWAVTSLVFQLDYQNPLPRAERFFDIYFLLVIASQFLRLILQLPTDGRYGGIGLSVGGTGYLTAIFVIYCLYCREYTNKVRWMILLAFVGLFLSGQRTNLLMCVIFCIPYVAGNFTGSALNGKINQSATKKLGILWGIFIIAVIGILVLTSLSDIGIEIPGFSFIYRVFDAVEKFFSGNIEDVSAVGGRILSLDAGIQILYEHPLGIRNVFYDLQYKVTNLNYPTYPHSTLLSCALLWSTPVTVFCVAWLVKLCIELRKDRNGLFWIILFILVMSVIWGSPFLNFQMLFIDLFFISISKLQVNYR